MRAAADILSSDDEQEATKVPIRPRQRSLRKRKSGFTTSLSSEELVRELYLTFVSVNSEGLLFCDRSKYL